MYPAARQSPGKISLLSFCELIKKVDKNGAFLEWVHFRYFCCILWHAVSYKKFVEVLFDAMQQKTVRLVDCITVVLLHNLFCATAQTCRNPAPLHVSSLITTFYLHSRNNLLWPPYSTPIQMFCCIPHRPILSPLITAQRTHIHIYIIATYLRAFAVSVVASIFHIEKLIVISQHTWQITQFWLFIDMISAFIRWDDTRNVGLYDTAGFPEAALVRRWDVEIYDDIAVGMCISWMDGGE